MKAILKFYLFAMVVLLSVMGAFAQTGGITVSGIVKSESPDATLPAVSVTLKGSTIGTATDASGKYSITVPAASDTLVFTYIGFVNQEIRVGNRTTINVTLLPSDTFLNEVLVVGYGTQNRKDVTGSIASVSSEVIKNQPASNIESLLQGRAAGVQISSTSGAPGSNLNIRIRGGSSINAGNEPLYVIDGIPLMNDNQDPAGTSYGTATPTNALTSLNPGDIESIQILKDASSSAIYGSRANNGVVIITTKRGKGDRVNVAYNGYYGTQTAVRRLDLMNAAQHAEFLNDWADATGITRPFADAASLGTGTDWQDEILTSAPMQNHQFSVSSGKGDVKYYVSANYFGQNGVIMNSGLKRYAFRVNLDGNITSRLKFKQALMYNRTISNSLPSSNEGVGNVRSAAERSWVTSPTIPVYDQNGEFVSTWYGAAKPDNPIAALSSIYNQLEGDNLMGNISLEYEIVNGLTAKSLFGVNLMNRQLGEYYPGTTTYIGSLFSGMGINSNKRITNVLNENTIRYVRNFNQVHNLELLGGFTWQTESDFGNSAQASGFADDRLGIFNVGAGTAVPIVNSNNTEWSLASGLSRINYQYNNKYLLTASLRADGSSRFGAGNKWGFFPSVALGYRLSEENFIKDLKVIDDLKIRGSYGFTGNQEIGAYQSLARLANDLVYIFGNSLVAGSRQTSLTNSSLRWEKAAQFDLGFDLSFLNNRFQFVFDYYEKKTQDLLFTINLPGTSGYSTALFNTGAVENKGIELSLNAGIFNKAFKWDAAINYTRNRNKITSLGRNASTSLFVGYPPGVGLRYVYEGVFHNDVEITQQTVQKGVEPGDARYQDVNGDGVLNSDDRILTGNPFPDYIFGFNNNLSFKGLTLSVFMQGSIGGEGAQLNALFNPADVSSNKDTELLNRWTPQNPNSDVPRAGVSNWLSSTKDLEDLSYFKIRNIQLGYAIPAKALPFKGTANIYVSGQNLITVTDYSGYDPDGGINYPTAKTLMFGLNVNF